MPQGGCGYRLTQVVCSSILVQVNGLQPGPVPYRDRGKESGWAVCFPEARFLLSFLFHPELRRARQEAVGSKGSLRVFWMGFTQEMFDDMVFQRG